MNHDVGSHWGRAITRWPCVTASTLLALGLMMAPRLASAHQFWVMPDAFSFKLGQAPVLQLRVGAGWPGEVRSPDPERTLRLDWIDGGGTRRLNPAADGKNASARTPGWAWVVYRSNHARLTLPADAFEAYLREEGLEHVIDTRRSRGETLASGTEIYSRCAKAMLRVGGAADTAGGAARSAAKLDRVAGLSLEVVPLTDPRLRAQGGPFKFALRLNGRPLVGALLKAFAQKGGPTSLRARSDAFGRVTLALPSAGVWMFSTVHMRPAPADTGADWESLWSSLTLQLGTVAP